MARIKLQLCSVLVALLLASSAGALTYAISASADGAQEVPAVITLGTGTTTGFYNVGTNLLTWSGSFSGLTGTTTVAHFHGPGALGVPAGVQLGFAIPVGMQSGVYGGSATLTALQETQLLSGLWYVNIHTTFKPGGEIRGQVYAVVPEPSTVAMLGLGLVGLGWIRRHGV